MLDTNIPTHGQVRCFQYDLITVKQMWLFIAATSVQTQLFCVTSRCLSYPSTRPRGRRNPRRNRHRRVDEKFGVKTDGCTTVQMAP